MGYCRLGYHKGLNNVSWPHENLSKNEKVIFHLKEEIICKGLYVFKHYYIYKDNTIYFLDFFEIIYQLYQFRGCFSKDTGRNGGRNLGTFTNVTSEYQCQMKCQENEKCEYFVYKKSQFECKLTNKSASPIKRIGHLFGPKYC